MDILNVKYFPRVSDLLLQLPLCQTRSHLNDGSLNLPCPTVTTARTSDGDGVMQAPPPLPHPAEHAGLQPGAPTHRIQGSGHAGRHVWPDASSLLLTLPRREGSRERRPRVSGGLAGGGGRGQEGGQQSTLKPWVTRAFCTQVRGTELSLRRGRARHEDSQPAQPVCRIHSTPPGQHGGHNSCCS